MVIIQLRQIISFQLNWVFMDCHLCWYNLGTLSKDYTGNTANMGKNDTLFKNQEPQTPYPYTVANTFIAHVGVPPALGN